MTMNGPSTIRINRKAHSVLLTVASVILLAMLLAGCSAEPSPDPVTRSPQSPALSSNTAYHPTATPTPSPTATPTPSPTAAPTATATPTPSPSPTPTLTPTSTPIPKQDILDYVRWEIGDKVSSDYRNEAIKGVQLAHDYSVLLGMPKTQNEVTAHMYHDTEKLVSAYARETSSRIEQVRTHWENDRGVVVGNAIAYKNHFFVNVTSSTKSLN